MTGAEVHVIASHLLGCAAIGVVIVALQFSKIQVISDDPLGDLEHIGWHIVTCLGDGHQSELAVGCLTIVPACVHAVLDSGVDIVDLSIHSIQILGLEVCGLCDP
jgi:hypothetical protein